MPLMSSTLTVKFFTTSATWEVQEVRDSLSLLWLSGGTMVKNPSANVGVSGDAGFILEREDLLEEEMAIHSVFLPGKFPWTEEPGGLCSPCGQK